MRSTRPGAGKPADERGAVASAARRSPLSAWQRRWRAALGAADAGNAPLELVILTPIIVFLIGFVIAAGRTTIAQGAVNAAAREAARQASIALTADAAQANADSTAQSALSSDGLDCTAVVTLDLSGFSVPPGQPAQVQATVSCTVALSDLLVPGLPGSQTLTASFTSPLDPYRTRSLGPAEASAGRSLW